MIEAKFSTINKIDLKTQTSFLNQFITVIIQFHQRVSSVFLPTAIKFHYFFNLRDLSNIVQVTKLFFFEQNKIMQTKLIDHVCSESIYLTLTYY